MKMCIWIKPKETVFLIFYTEEITVTYGRSTMNKLKSLKMKMNIKKCSLYKKNKMKIKFSHSI